MTRVLEADTAVVERNHGGSLELLVDYRLGGVPRRYFGRPEDVLMRVADEVRKCAVFLCYKHVSKAGEITFKPAGTGFFVSVPYAPNLEASALYIVTARHVVDGIPQVGADGMIHIRMNRGGDPGYEIISVARKEWVTHPSDENIDVAVLRPPELAGPPVDFRSIPVAMAATPEIRDKEGIGVGDEIALTGLFVNHQGKKRNLPIVRIGNIALMPEEPLVDKDGATRDAILVEARSIGGLSGSPVFVQVTATRGGRAGLEVTPSFRWLGLMHGHWDGRLTEADAVGPKDERVNMGIAIVVPVEKILEVLDVDQFVQERKAMAGLYQQSEPHTED